MKRIINLSFNFALLAGIFVLLGFMRNEHGTAICSNIRVSVDYHKSDTLISSDEIYNMIQSKFDTLQGQNIQLSQLSEIKQSISAIPYILKADVDFPLNGTLRIRASQRIPIVKIMAGSQSWYIDQLGVVMPRHKSFSARVPVASGHLGQTAALKTGNNLQTLADTNAVFTGSRINQVLMMAKFIHNDKLLSSLIEQIYLNPEGSIELFTYVGGQRILFGKAEDFEEKFSKLLTFYRSGPVLKGINKYRTIDLKYNNQVVCSK